VIGKREQATGIRKENSKLKIQNSKLKTQNSLFPNTLASRLSKNTPHSRIAMR